MLAVGTSAVSEEALVSVSDAAVVSVSLMVHGRALVAVLTATVWSAIAEMVGVSLITVKVVVPLLPPLEAVTV